VAMISETTPTATLPETRTDLLGLPREELAQALAPVVDRPFRAGQIYSALYERGAADFSEMTDLSKDLRARLAERFRIGLPAISERQLASDAAWRTAPPSKPSTSRTAAAAPSASRARPAARSPAPSASPATGAPAAT
jgi:23S rRNA (cytidine(2498)-2'-O)-methyltransferase RlmM-like protein